MTSLIRQQSADPPLVLAIGGHDPTGGAGIQADIETLKALDCQPLTLVTALTAQDSSGIHGCWPVDSEQFMHQLETLDSDFTIDVIKLGLMCDPDLITKLSDWLAGHPDIPVICDPVLAPGGSGQFISDRSLLKRSLLSGLLPRVDLLCPNTAEAMELVSTDTADTAAAKLLDNGCKAVLITGTDADNRNEIEHVLFQHKQQRKGFFCRRIPGRFHGSGCTLASAISAGVARRLALEEAISMAIEFTLGSLQQATQPGRDQSFPNRRSGFSAG